MPETRENVLAMMLTELREAALQELRRENNEHDRRLKSIAGLDEQVRTYLATVGEDKRSLIESYLNERTLATSTEQDFLYMRSVKDFVWLIRTLGCI